MIEKIPLQTIQADIAEEPASSSLEIAVKAFLKNQPFSIHEVIEDCRWNETMMSTEKAIENWKELLAVNLLNYLSGNPVYQPLVENSHFDSARQSQIEAMRSDRRSPAPSRQGEEEDQFGKTAGSKNGKFQLEAGIKEIAAKVCLFERQVWDEGSQYFRVLVALNHWLAKMPVPEMDIHLLENGAALIDLHEYSPLLAIPYIPYHLELGIFLSLSILLTKQEEWKGSLVRLAKWQLNTLDANYRPLHALFVRESEGDYLQQLRLYYLFFKSVARLTEEKEFECASHALYAILIKEASLLSVHPLWALIEKIFTLDHEFFFPSFPLPEYIYDPSTSLAGYRSAAQHAICTLHGAGTGMGCFRWEDIEIFNYGPQYLPLENCRGFGIEGNHLSDHGLRKPAIELKRNGFLLKGCARLVDEPSLSPFQIGKFRGIWLEMVQEFKQPCLNLSASFLGLDGWEGTAFSFFVKAEKCQIGSLAALLPGTLERFEGKAHSLQLVGENSVVHLNISAFNGTMQIIPLEGKQNFWGANFLISYIMNPDQRHYQWEIIPRAGEFSNQGLSETKQN